jgi:hypothetical protein
MIDVRSTHPNRTRHRRARFLIGYSHAVEGRHYTPSTLSRLTWQNKGWREGIRLGPASRAEIRERYERCVLEQTQGAGSGDDC